MKDKMSYDRLRVNIDMDGVLADFDRFAIEILGHKFDLFPTSQAAWDAMKDHQDIYLKLQPMPDANELVRGIYDLRDEYEFHIAILTAIPKIGRIPLAALHKRIWLDQWFPELNFDFNIGPHAEHKQLHCIVGDVLIDDSDKNIPQWNSRDGYGILHTSAAKSLAELEAYLKEVKN